ncbi:hypothetical protein D1815_18300 [Aquimarina sp. AD1]|uniref:DUF5686 and carboxypeptidase-like regulatory domain-containing protein n=2 Tax=Aquimarina sp. (strain AD1) TaxID=1714848 RepID=UPI000E4933BB|nr:DUF5686 and carboxypeptidase-like regulatory domain-containing protein [Aquimarina sp. AD1]AXT57606.1 hypothetical protein D1815_18300 [Aquimarina sp. AD1]
MYRIVIWCFLLVGSSIFSQKSLKGKVLDFNTKEPLAFSTIVFNNNKTLGTITDIDGNFVFSSDTDINSLVCSYLGYNKKTIDVIDTTYIVIELIPKENQLDQVVISSTENPANRIIRNAIKNREINDPEKLQSFAYNSYNKIIFDVRSKKNKDSVSLVKRLKGGHMMIMESITRRKFLEPDLSNEVVVGTKVSGFRNPQFASLATDIQPFSFYTDMINLFEVNYLNPISKGSLKKYKFFLEESIPVKKDTIHVISFQPKANKNFEGLKGIIHINTNKFAIQNVTASPYQKGKIDLKIQQKYTLLRDSIWFPEQLNYKLSMPEYPSKENNLVMNGKSYITNISLDTLLQKRDFPIEVVSIAEGATKKDSVFWNLNRNTVLNPKEKITYRVLDSIGEKVDLDKFLTLSESLFRGKIPVGMVDIDINKTIIMNQFEGFRLGTGLYTNDKFDDRLSLGGFVGYGFDDKDWKYGGEVNYSVSKKNEVSIGYQYQVNLREVGNYNRQQQDLEFLNFRSYLGFNFDKIREHSVNVHFRSLKYLTADLSFNHTSVNPKYEYEFISETTNLREYTNSSLSLNLRYAYKEKMINSFNQRFTSGTDYPVIGFSFSKGFDDILDGDIDYNKIEVSLDHSFYTKSFGKTSYRMEGGYIDSAVPYGLSFTGKGNYDTDYPFFSKNLFQTMTPYEFVSDRYANLFIAHNFEGLLFKIGKFQPDIVVHQNIGWGNLINNNNALVPFNTMDEVFLESGLELKSLFKVNYLNLGYLGFGLGGFYRYGFYSNEDFEDNLAIKFNISFKIK